ncbi:protein SCO1/2 [Loktanella sp. DSM 29012]|uniref:SCO family protein n=1 Tax=unclassified Loktanella TaxID=290910 RepID=UPI000701E196|nr:MULTISPECIES: SCO family protein [unclassified Loktanella]KQI70109.1 protein senC [Loktanella sp. 3ANDIMAR09]SEP61474.1 protein SCO1/2 [Loktanella sp. DSM 29012]
MNRAIVLVSGAAIAAVVGVSLSLTFNRGQDLASCFSTNAEGADIGGPFTLVNQEGQTVTDANVITEPTLVYFGYGFCPDVCPIDNARNVAAVDLLAEQGVSVTPVFISVDPARDTPEFMADYAANMHPKMIGLTGSEAQVKAAADAYKVYYARNGDDPDYYLVDHSAFTYLMLPDTGFATFFRRDTPPQQIAQEVSCALT